MLGARLGRAGRASGTLRRRVALGVRLHREGAAPLLLLSGGGAGPVPEAAIMRDLAAAAGIPAPALLSETLSCNTVDNAFECARLLRARQCSRVVLVSDRLHLPRAGLLFGLAGLSVVRRVGVPARSPSAALIAALHEAAALPRSLFRAVCRRRLGRR